MEPHTKPGKKLIEVCKNQTNHQSAEPKTFNIEGLTLLTPRLHNKLLQKQNSPDDWQHPLSQTPSKVTGQQILKDYKFATSNAQDQFRELVWTKKTSPRQKHTAYTFEDETAQET